MRMCLLSIPIKVLQSRIRIRSFASCSLRLVEVRFGLVSFMSKKLVVEG